MIKSISIEANGTIQYLELPAELPQKIEFPAAMHTGTTIVKIEFSGQFSTVRNHDYRWIPAESGHVSPFLAPKILRMKTGEIIQASMAAGVWELKSKSALHWIFNHPDAAPLTVYTGHTHEREISAARTAMQRVPALLIAKNGVEFSRSPHDFKAVACFTDHCDFDTAESLAIQRKLFKDAGIRVTKGFFLNHFSKRADNASWERDSAELSQWRSDGHELAYHALSQSIPESGAITTFRNFEPPMPDIPTYIDHGYLPYNFSLFRQNQITESTYAALLEEKNIAILWNYIDSGTTGHGVLNQMNRHQFSLKSFASATASFALKKKVSLLIRAIVFHHLGNRRIISAYKNVAGNVKRGGWGTHFFKAVFEGFVLLKAFMRVLFRWKSESRKSFRLARFSPIVFRHILGDKNFTIFQTVEMTDFKASLSRENLDNLCAESGLFIAHTYFSVPFDYHHGRLIRNGKPDAEVEANFKYLGSRVAEGKVWNPTLSELVSYLKGFEQAELDVENGEILIKNSGGLHYRIIE